MVVLLLLPLPLLLLLLLVLTAFPSTVAKRRRGDGCGSCDVDCGKNKLHNLPHSVRLLFSPFARRVDAWWVALCNVAVVGVVDVICGST